MPLFFLIIFFTFAAHVFVAQPVEQLTLNQWVRGSNPREDTHLRFGFLNLLKEEGRNSITNYELRITALNLRQLYNVSH